VYTNSFQRNYIGAISILLLPFHLSKHVDAADANPKQRYVYMQTKPHLPNMQIDTNRMQPYIKHYYCDL